MRWGRGAERGARHLDQRGFALIEVIAALLFLTVTMSALAGAVMAVLGAASRHRDVVRSGVESIDIAEELNRGPYVQCQTASQVRTALGFPKTVDGFELDVDEVDYLKSRAASSAEWVDQPTCTAAGDQGLQRVHIAVVRPNGRGVERLQFVMRDDTCVNVTTTLADQEC